MREPAFWWERPGLYARLILPLSMIYGAVARWRMNRSGTRAGIPVICVGNFTLGGTGKTPTAIAISRLLMGMGEKPFFLSRGYGGALAGPLRVDPANHGAADVGDEPLLLARIAPVIVSRDRVAGAALARSSGATVIVMDDGLQNPSLVKDLSIAVMDARRELGNAMVFPAGPLRAPLQAQLVHTQALLLIGKGAGATQAIELTRGDGRLLLRANLEPAADAFKAIGRRKVYAFAGIGDPEKFFTTLSSVGIEAQVEESFPDHHPYSEAEATRILKRCEREKLVAVTTEKDLARMGRASGAVARLAASAKAMPVSLVSDDADLLKRLLREALTKARAVS
ncbi:MAG: tetraacyldisaccharide 4'-kinase [Pseudorhodoplanes sp.]